MSERWFFIEILRDFETRGSGFGLGSGVLWTTHHCADTDVCPECSQEENCRLAHYCMKVIPADWVIFWSIRILGCLVSISSSHHHSRDLRQWRRLWAASFAQPLHLPLPGFLPWSRWGMHDGGLVPGAIQERPDVAEWLGDPCQRDQFAVCHRGRRGCTGLTGRGMWRWITGGRGRRGWGSIGAIIMFSGVPKGAILPRVFFLSCSIRVDYNGCLLSQPITFGLFDVTFGWGGLDGGVVCQGNLWILL